MFFFVFEEGLIKFPSNRVTKVSSFKVSMFLSGREGGRTNETNTQFTIFSPVQPSGIALSSFLPESVALEIVLP